MWVTAPVSVLDRRAVGHQQFAASAAHVGVEHGGQQRQQETAAASTFQLVLVDVPVEIVVGVAPPLDSGPLWCERCCQREQGLVEVVIDDGLLSRCVNRAGRTGFGSPAELSTTVVFLLESPVDVTQVA